MNQAERTRTQEELSRLLAELEERRSSLPAHSVRPRQILAVEELEARVAELCRRLGAEE